MKPDFIAGIAAHLNAPYGKVVHEETVAAVLKSGEFQSVKCGELEMSLLKTMFSECAPSLIGRACYQAGSTLEEGHKLYLDLLKEGHPVVHGWQDAVKGIVA